MKKYIKPEIVSALMESEDMIAVSLFDGEMKQNLDDAPTTPETGGNLSRQSFWDDED